MITFSGATFISKTPLKISLPIKDVAPWVMAIEMRSRNPAEIKFIFLFYLSFLREKEGDSIFKIELGLDKELDGPY